MQTFFIHREGERVGPFALEEINRQLAAGILQPTDLGWSEVSPGWKPLLSFTGVLMPGAASSSAMAVAIATPLHGPTREYAGFWIRLAAGMIDAIALGVVVMLLVLLFPSANEKMSILRNVTAALLCFFYMPVMWASGFEATLGQRLLGLQVLRTNGAPISFARALKRAFGVLISIAPLGFGFIVIGFSNRKLAWHDRMAETCVQRSTSSM
jgi:uncharacterized RDD family membrane protein YckC